MRIGQRQIHHSARKDRRHLGCDGVPGRDALQSGFVVDLLVGWIGGGDGARKRELREHDPNTPLPGVSITLMARSSSAV